MKEKTSVTPSSTSKKSSSRGRSQVDQDVSVSEYQTILAAAEEIAKIGSWKWDLATQKVTWSDEMFQLFGVERQGFDGDLNRVIAERIHPEDKAAVKEASRKVLEEATTSPMSYRIVLPNGMERTVWAQGKLICDESGQPEALIGFVQDITERVRAEKKVLQLKRLYATLSQVNQMIVRIKERDELFHTICDVAVQFGEFSLAWVGLLDEATGDVQPIKAHGMDIRNWHLPVVNIHDGPLSHGLVARAIQTGNVITSRDAQLDDRLQVLHDSLRQEGFRSSAVVPFRLRNKTIGIVCMISQEKGLFEDEDEIRLLDEMGLDISFALDNMENEKERQLAEELFSRAFRSSPVAIILSRVADGVFIDVNDTACQIYGYTREELLGHTSLELGIIHPEERRKIIEALQSQGILRNIEVTVYSRREGARVVLYSMERLDVDGVQCMLTAMIDITQRKKAEEQLRENEERLRLSLQAANQGLYDLNVQTGNAIVNRQYAEMLGYDFETFVETNAFWIERLHPDDQEITGKAYTDYVSGLRPEYRVEFRQRTKDGKWKWILSLGKVIEYDEQGNPLRMLGTHTDITERKQAEEALRQSKERYRLISENSADVIWVMDPLAGRFTYVSPSVEKLRGYTAAEVIAQPVEDALTPESFKMVSESLARDLPSFIAEGAGTRSFVNEVDQPRKDGSIVHTEVTTNFMFNEQGQVEIIGVTRDITGRRQMQDALQRSERVLRLFVEHSPASIAMFDRQMRYIVASRRYLIDYRLGEQNLTGRSHYEIFPEIPDRWKEIHQRCLQGAIEMAEEEAFPREDGTLDWVRWEIRPWYEENEKIGGIILFSEVITERKHVQDQLHILNQGLEQRVRDRTLELSHANRAKDEFLANMSHELRTPLNTVLGLSETLLEQRRGPLNEKQIQSIELISSSGQHLLSLINDILEISKIEAGKLELHPTRVHVRELCESSLNFIKELASRKLIAVDFRNETSIDSLRADPQRLKQILINLLTNAVKFTPERGNIRLEVSTNEEQDQILFSVIDNGIGITEQDLKKLFVPFVQLDSSLARQYSGTGLGLALVQKLTELHGGSVHVESEAGRGSRFTIALPLDRATRVQDTENSMKPVQSMQGISSKSATAPKERNHVLLAEDNEINSNMMSEYLEAQGYHVITARDGEEVLEKVRVSPPDIILMDIQMPKLDGLQATRQLRADPRFASTPIIALTALAMPGDKERCFEAGVNEYLSKPVGLRKLVQLIEKMTGAAN